MENYKMFASPFEEDGYVFAAYLPIDDSVPLSILVIISKDGKEYDKFLVPMTHEPRFGVDVEDIGALEGATAAYIAGGFKRDKRFCKGCGGNMEYGPNKIAVHMKHCPEAE